MDLNRLGRGVYGNAVARLFELDDINAVPTLAPEIMPVSSIWERPEFWALLGGTLASGRGVVAAGGAGTVGEVAIFNPLTSGVLGIVEKFSSATAILTAWRVTTGTGTLAATLNNKTHRDLRRIVNSDNRAGINLEFLTGTQAPGAGDTVGSRTGPFEQELDMILPPGWGLVVRGPDNTAVDFTIHWRERAASKLELRLS